MDARIVDGRKIARVTDDGKLKVLVHGRDGDDLVPVKVSEDGYLMLATDATPEWFVRLYGRLGTYTGTGESYEFDNIMLIDLTEAFGAGNEPTLEEIEDIIAEQGGVLGGGISFLRTKWLLIGCLKKLSTPKSYIIPNIQTQHTSYRPTTLGIQTLYATLLQMETS
jgi:hypothetical protein